MRRIIIAILFLFVLKIGLTQDYSKAADCSNSIDLSGFLSGTIPAPVGFGEIKEIKGFDLRSKHFFTEEHNTYWFHTTFNSDTEFEFIITPEYAEDDYDFLVFHDTTGNFCEDIRNKEILPVRTNLSRVKPEEGSITGLKKGARKTFETAGRGDTYSKPLYAKAGQKYYIIVDSPYGAEGGFGMEMFYDGKNAQGETLESRQSKIVQKRSAKGRKTENHKMFIAVRSSEDSAFLKDVDLSLNGLSEEDELEYVDNLFEVSYIHHYRTYKMRIDKEGYKQANYSYHHTFDVDTTLTIYLDKLEQGSKLSFTNINFAPNSSRVLQSSLGDLNDMMIFLKTNPNISVEIMGHVNGVGGKKGKQKKLSKKRAKTIYELLVSYGIPPDRLTYNGYGGSMMIYSAPLNEKQAQQNRRVDVRVTKI